ncbi:MAG TPA: hypothetical protein PKD45_14245 [Flavobacteriales bacterium]|nr:hypothetical protein [Flavobacteriales bacterium]
MKYEPVEVRTGIATLRRVAPDLLEIIYGPGITFHAQAVAEVQAQRRDLMGDRQYGTLTIIPGDVDYNTDSMGRNQSVEDQAKDLMVANAVVVKAEMIELLTRLYLSYFPQRQKVLVTTDEEAARTWLLDQMKAAGCIDGTAR